MFGTKSLKIICSVASGTTASSSGTTAVASGITAAASGTTAASSGTTAVASGITAVASGTTAVASDTITYNVLNLRLSVIFNAKSLPLGFDEIKVRVLLQCLNLFITKTCKSSFKMIILMKIVLNPYIY